MTPENKNLKRWFIIAKLIGLGFVGLLLSEVVEKLFYSSEKEMMQNPYWATLVYISAFLFIFSLMVLVPIQILGFERKQRKNQPVEKVTVSDLLGLPFGAFNPDAELPKWIGIPVLVIFWIIGIVFGLIIVAGIIWLIMFFLK